MDSELEELEEELGEMFWYNQVEEFFRIYRAPDDVLVYAPVDEDTREPLKDEELEVLDNSMKKTMLWRMIKYMEK